MLAAVVADSNCPGCRPGTSRGSVCIQVVLLVGQPLSVAQRWDEACTAHGAAFYAAETRGTLGYFFANLHKHTYTLTVS